MSSVDTLALMKDLIESPDETVHRATAMLAEHEDPRIRLIAEMWARNRTEQQEAAQKLEDASEPDVPVEVAFDETEWRDALIEKLKRRLVSIARDLRDEREAVLMLTSAIGACHCLGEDPDCDDCHGRGVPGALAPDPECFTRYVMPVMRLLRERHRATAISRPESPGRDDASIERSEK